MRKNTRVKIWPQASAAVLTLALLFAFSFPSFPEAAAADGKTAPKHRMVLGDPAPDFQLPDVVSGREYSLDDFSDKKGLLVVILCRHCPYVKHIRKALARFAKDYAGKDLALAAISANDPEAYPEDSPEKLKEMALEQGFTFPVLFDSTQKTAADFSAQATPDFFLFGPERTLVYRGQFDDTRPRGGKEATGKDVRAAVDALLAGREIPAEQQAAVGCSIKWKPGHRPEYL